LVILQSYDEQGRTFTTLTEGGMLAKIGMSKGGLAIGLNILRSVTDGATPGVPVHVVLRHLLSCQSVAEARLALAHIQTLKFGAASNIPVADAMGEVACFEISPGGWDEVKPVDGCVVHTNHFLCESLSDQQSPMGLALSSTPRLISGLRHAAAVKQGQLIGFEELQNFLRDESDGLWSICRSPDPAIPPEARVESVAGIIMLPHTRSIWIAPNVPKLVAFEKIA
jgi:isopenicillin-N N-acyltransferase-like protein